MHWHKSAARFALLTAIGLAPTPSSRAEAPCAAPTATAEINACAEQAYDAADRELNDVYQKARAYVARHGAEKPYDSKTWDEALRAAQKAWIAFRDADCKGEVPVRWGGGSGATADVLGCLTEKTRARTRELAQRFELE